MTIKEIEKLVDFEIAKKLRKPNCMVAKNEDEQKEIVDLFRAIRYFMGRNVALKFFEIIDNRQEDSAAKCIYYSPIINSFKGCGTEDKPFQIDTTFGTGECYDVSALINLKGLRYYQHGNCFTNSFDLTAALTKTGYTCKQLSGIAYLEKPFLHSVVCIEFDDKSRYIMDFNYDIIMSYDLYVKFLSFEVLAKTEGQVIVDDIDSIFKTCKDYKIDASNYCLAFAYEETIAQIKKDVEEYYLH